MKFSFLVLANLWRKPVRTMLTAMSLVVAFLLFGLLEPIVQLFENGSRAGDTSRWWVAPRHSISDMLPVRYHQQIQRVEGVQTAAHQTWFGGTYIDAVSSSAFTRWAISPEEFLNINPQMILAKDQRNAFLTTRTGAIVGRSVADRFQMKVGDRIPIVADIWHNADGSEWHFDLVGIYDSPPDEQADTSRFFVNYAFFDEYRVIGKGLISIVLYTVNEVVEAPKIARSLYQQY
jgi:putative ABC transport system permease protein